MIDYRQVFGLTKLSEEADDGSCMKVAVLDTGTPSVDSIFVCQSKNFTSDTSKDAAHATFVGSILFGRGEITGICPKAYTCFGKVFDGLTARPSAVATAIDYAVDCWGADVINMSFGFTRGGQCPQQVVKACKKAYDKGKILVAASGNDGGRAMWPAALPYVIGVGSCNGDSREDWSNRGEIDFVVPGDLKGIGSDGCVTEKRGTSFSTAVVTGVITLILASRRIKGLSTLPEDIKGDLISRCTDIGVVGWDEDTGYGVPVEPVMTYRLCIKTPWYVSLPYSTIFAKIKSLVDKIINFLKRRRNRNEQF